MVDVTRIRAFVRRVRESLFLVPLLIMAACSGLAALALYLDDFVTREALDNIPVLLSSTIAGGRSIATTVAGATITVAAIVFSITALSSQIAANQYSPRAVAGFFEDPFQQVIIGLIVGTFTYSLLILGGLSATLASNSEPVPSVAVTFAIFLGVASAIGIVAYIDHSLRRFQVDSVVRRIAQATLAAIKKRNRQIHDDHLAGDSTPPSGPSFSVDANRTGWIQDLNPASLAKAAPPNSSVRVNVRLGEPVSRGDKIFTVWAEGDVDSDLIANRLRDRIRIGRDRSLDNDPAFGIRQLVDIALKALSPGINDPTTAVDVVHQLKVPIREILLSDTPSRVYNGPDDQRVYLPQTPTRSDFVHFAFAEIRMMAGNQASVLSALLEVLGDLIEEMEGGEFTGRIGALEQERNLTVQATRESGLPEPDIERVLAGEEAVGDEGVPGPSPAP